MGSLVTEYCLISREESKAVGPLWLPGHQMTPLSYWARRRKKSLSSPWKGIVKPVLQHPSRDFHAVPFIIKSREAITLHQCHGRCASVLGETERKVILIHPPVLETESFASAFVAKGRVTAALGLREEGCFPVSYVRSLSCSICEIWRLL